MLSGLATWLLAVAVGFLAVRLMCVGARDLLSARVMQRDNYRGARLPSAAGILVVFAVLFVEAGRCGLGALGVGEVTGLTMERVLVLFAVFGFGVLGFVDDLAAEGETRGFRGHLRAALDGRLTTGFVKLAGGGAVSVVLVATPGFASGRRLVVDALLIALAANLGNLLDRRPGRVIKVGLVAYVPLAWVLGAGPVGVALAPVMGAFAGVLPDDLRERLMIGDTGANVLGAALGLGVVLGCGEGTRLVVLAAVVTLNVVAELVSFTKVIERVALLRSIDEWGRAH